MTPKTSKYIYANIKIPIEIEPDGKIKSLREYINIQFTKCEELPEKNQSDVNYSFIQNNLNQILSQLQIADKSTDKETASHQESVSASPSAKDDLEPEQNKLTVFANEIKTEKRETRNTSFKQKSKPAINRYTMKNR